MGRNVTTWARLSNDFSLRPRERLLLQSFTLIDFSGLLFQYAFTGSEPPGVYLAYAALIQPGADPLNPANWITLDVFPFGCPLAPISIGQTVSGSLTDSDCKAPHRPGRKADLYAFSGTAGQRVTIAMDSSVFDTYLS